VNPTHRSRPSRRQFLTTTAATSAAAATLAHAPLVHAGGTDVLKIGLIGCGSRGTGAASQALRADSHVKLWAMADAFESQVNGSLQNLRRDGDIAEKIDVPQARRFVGLDAYQDVINSGVDVVLLCTTPHFRPIHLEAAVRAGKHVFCEKPMAVDAPGVRRVLAAAQEARRRRLALVAGFCWRYYNAMRETVHRIHDGALGEIHTLHCNYLTNPVWYRERRPGSTEMEYQIWNWYNFTWLSGDFNVEQHVHSLDKMGWIMQNQYPARCYGTGGRSVRPEDRSPQIYDHMAVVYEWANGTRCFAFCRQQPNCFSETTDWVAGTRGKATLLARGATPYTISGAITWRYPAARLRSDPDMYQVEHNELFASIRAGNPINDGEWMAKSTLMAIMGRMACYTGQAITWEQAMNSQQSLSPSAYRFDADPPPATVARPGVTRFS
jgi:myo-inositol 2-dehydrogenase/D-chiro-inositol 1-dehydrogenase